MKLHVDHNEPRCPDRKQFELEGWIDSSPFEELLGLRVEWADAGRALLTMPFTVKLANGGGVMHGGALTTLADTAVAMAIKSLLPPGTTFATTELTTQFVAPVLTGQVRAQAEVNSPDGRTFHGTCVLLGEHEEVFANFTSVFKVARNRK